MAAGGLSIPWLIFFGHSYVGDSSPISVPDYIHSMYHLMDWNV